MNIMYNNIHLKMYKTDFGLPVLNINQRVLLVKMETVVHYSNKKML